MLRWNDITIAPCPPEGARKSKIISGYMNYKNIKTPPYIVELAKDLRHNMTVSEEKLCPRRGIGGWKVLNEINYFTRQSGN